MDTTLIDLILDGKYLPAVGAALVLIVGLLRYTLTKLTSTWFSTKFGGYVLAYGAAFALYLGTAWQAGEPADAHIIFAALVAAITSSGLLDHWRDILSVAKKTPPAVGGAVSALLIILGTACTACPGTAPTGGSVTNAVVDCAHGGIDVQDKIDGLIAEMAKFLVGGSPDWTHVEALAVIGGIQVGGCALAQVVDDWITKKSLHDGDAVAQTRLARSTLEDYRTKHAGGASFRTAHGDL